MASFASERSAFVLPYTLLLATTLLLLALLGLDNSLQRLQQARAQELRFRAETLITRNVESLAGGLNQTLREDKAASALLGTDWQEAGLQSAAIVAGKEESVPLYSVSHDKARGNLQFRSPVRDLFLEAELTVFSPPESRYSAEFAWTAEDIALHSPMGMAFPAWPASRWAGSPRRLPVDPKTLLRDQMGTGWLDGPWIVEDTLPFTPANSPALVPVVTSLGLRFGIFASGKSGSREKTVRIRYYIEGGIWNPYNRPMGFHEGSGRRPVFRVGFMNLPAVRLRNLSKGVTTKWIQLDEAVNGQTGEAGLEAWIRLPGTIGAGESLDFHEPDLKSQPEGLARTLHPAFLVDPDDRILIEFRPAPEGLGAVCLPMGGEPLREAWSAGKAWDAVHGYPAEFTDLSFDRADAPPAPFHLEGGSLAFRITDAQFQVLLAMRPDTLAGRMDPRRRSMAYQAVFQDAEGRPLSGNDWVEIAVVPLREESPGKVTAVTPGALFSWPRREPETLLEATDLPGWREGFRMGSPGARAINILLDHEEPILPAGIPELVTSLPVNMIDSRAWESVLSDSAAFSVEDGTLRFPAFPDVSPDRPEDFHFIHSAPLEWAAESLAHEISRQPSASVADFFDRGILGKVLPDSSLPPALLNLLPLRGWLREAPPFRRHGSAWVLHLFARCSDGERTFQRSARAWLLEQPQPDGTSRFGVIRFEWTDPDQHCRFPRD